MPVPQRVSSTMGLEKDDMGVHTPRASKGLQKSASAEPLAHNWADEVVQQQDDGPEGAE